MSDPRSLVTGYTVDGLGNLTQQVSPDTGTTTSTYDAAGNLLTQTDAKSQVASVTPSSGPVRIFAFDPNGSTTSDAVNSFGYDVRGRMTSATTGAGTTNYQVNALGQRIRKTNTDGDTVFHYDTRGRLIAETDQAGTLRREYLYLNELPMMVFQ